MTMNQAARLAACGDGCVIPMVLIKAFAMNWMNFMSFRWPAGKIVAEIRRCYVFGGAPNREIRLARIYKCSTYGWGLAGA